MISRYDLGEGRTLEFSREVIDNFLQFRQKPGRNEAGGILLGRVYPGGDVIIDRATTPNACDKAGPYFFDRSRAAAQNAVNRAWEESSGERNYLGEWHSHPVNHPTPSGRDRQMIRNMFRQSQLEVEFLFLVVIGGAESWVGLENGRSLKRLKPLLRSV
ncbi:MAG: Mov34/MPN/PAD-1 family protein [Acidobacteriota bacterium]|nr:Mov34/MPN/PAD-1 family protein [Acidobacteriota bacterium]